MKRIQHYSVFTIIACFSLLSFVNGQNGFNAKDLSGSPLITGTTDLETLGLTVTKSATPPTITVVDGKRQINCLTNQTLMLKATDLTAYPFKPTGDYTLEFRIAVPINNGRGFDLTIKDGKFSYWLMNVSHEKLWGATVTKNFYSLDSKRYHTYRFGIKRNLGEVHVWVDGLYKGIMQTSTSATIDNLLEFGKGSVAPFTNLHIDYVSFDFTGAYKPVSSILEEPTYTKKEMDSAPDLDGTKTPQDAGWSLATSTGMLTVGDGIITIESPINTQYTIQAPSFTITDKFSIEFKAKIESATGRGMDIVIGQELYCLTDTKLYKFSDLFSIAEFSENKFRTFRFAGSKTNKYIDVWIDGVYMGTFSSYTDGSRFQIGKNQSGSSTKLLIDYVTLNNTGEFRPYTTVSSAQNISSLSLLTPDSITVENSGYLTIDQNTPSVTINVQPEGKVTLPDNIALTSGKITIQSDANSTATFVDFNNITPQSVSGIVKQHLIAERNWYTTSPITLGTAANLSLGTSVQTYTESTKSWSILEETDALVVGKGYVSVAKSGTGNTGAVNFNGILNSGTITLAVTRTEAGNSRGFNLVANPYPSYLDWSLVKEDASNTNIGSTMWFRTKNTDGIYTFATHNGTSSETVTGTANTNITKLIPPMQAFWIRVKPNLNTSDVNYPNHNTSITFKNSMRAHRDEKGNSLKAPKQEDRKRLRLKVSNGTVADETLLYFDAKALDTFDDYDSPKMSNNSASIPEIYTQIGYEKLVINGMKDITYNTEIPIGFSTLTTGNFSISANEISNFESDTRVILIDKYSSNVETEISKGISYNFSAPITTSTTNRFSLIFRVPTTISGVNNVERSTVRVFVNEENKVSIMAAYKCGYSIYNLVGQKVIEGYTTAQPNIINYKLQAGIYVVIVSENGIELSKRVIIK